MAPEFEVSFTDPTDRPRVRPRSVAHTHERLCRARALPSGRPPGCATTSTSRSRERSGTSGASASPRFRGASALAVLRDRRLLVLARRLPPLENGGAGGDPPVVS